MIGFYRILRETEREVQRMTTVAKKQVGVRLTAEQKQKLEALTDLLGVSATQCIAILVDKAYTENRTAIESMIASRNALRVSEPAKPLFDE